MPEAATMTGRARQVGLWVMLVCCVPAPPVHGQLHVEEEVGIWLGVNYDKVRETT